LLFFSFKWHSEPPPHFHELESPLIWGRTAFNPLPSLPPPPHLHGVNHTPHTSFQDPPQLPPPAPAPEPPVYFSHIFWRKIDGHCRWERTLLPFPLPLGLTSFLRAADEDIMMERHRARLFLPSPFPFLSLPPSARTRFTGFCGHWANTGRHERQNAPANLHSSPLLFSILITRPDLSKTFFFSYAPATVSGAGHIWIFRRTLPLALSFLSLLFSFFLSSFLRVFSFFLARDGRHENKDRNAPGALPCLPLFLFFPFLPSPSGRDPSFMPFFLSTLTSRRDPFFFLFFLLLFPFRRQIRPFFHDASAHGFSSPFPPTSMSSWSFVFSPQLAAK